MDYAGLIITHVYSYFASQGKLKFSNRVLCIAHYTIDLTFQMCKEAKSNVKLATNLSFIINLSSETRIPHYVIKARQ